MALSHVPIQPGAARKDTRDLSASLWYPYLQSDRKLRIGVLADREGMSIWLASVLRDLELLPQLVFTELFLLSSPVREDRPKKSALFAKLHGWSQSQTNDPFALTQDCLLNAARHELGPCHGSALTSAQVEQITAAGLDILISATDSVRGGNCKGLTRHGVWSFQLGSAVAKQCHPPYWREVCDEEAVSTLLLMQHDERLETGAVIAEFATGTVPSLRFTQNCQAPLAAAAGLTGRCLLALAKDGSLRTTGATVERGQGADRWPSTIETGLFAMRKLGRSAKLRATSRGLEEMWFVAIRPHNGTFTPAQLCEGQRFQQIDAPLGHYYADPFLVEDGSRTWLFVEDWVYSLGRAVLTCMEVLPNGHFGEPAVILDRPYHLSYPHVFKHEGEYFMIPESSEGGDVELYRATKFPFQWTLESILAERTPLVDTTPYFADGVWYFFTQSYSHPQEAYLFTSDRIDGPWQYHPANPFCSDARRSRGAGTIFAHNGKLIRPAQDCSYEYGYAVSFNQITRLSKTEFREEEIGRFLPTWTPGLTGTHTYNSTRSYQVIDGKGLRRPNR